MWIMPQHSCKLEQFRMTLQMFQELNGVLKDENIEQDLLYEMKKRGLYNPRIVRNGKYDKSTANHKIDEVRFYGGIYLTTNGKIHITPYGELLLKHWNDILKRSKIFSSMLFSIQYPNPYKQIKGEDVYIYPFRLIFKLLTEKELGCYLDNLEVTYILYYVKNINNNKYFNIVKEIREFRSLSKDKKEFLVFKNAEEFVKNYVNFNYCLNILHGFNIIDFVEEKSSYFKIHSPKRKNSTSIRLRKFRLSSDIEKFIFEFSKKYSVFENIKEPSFLRNDWIREIYNFVAEELLVEIDEYDEEFREYLQLPNKLVDTSKDGKAWNEFEKCITKSFALFDDIKAEHIGGPGEPDTLCHYIKENINFVSDGKATSTKLIEINDGRLRQHRKKYNADFTIIVTPDYRPSAIEDIKNTKTCLITSFCFSDLIARYIFKRYKNKMECSFEKIYNIILNNLGDDISEKVYKFLDDKSGVASL